jgi:hypothetical protein
MTVGAAHQVALSPASHPANVLDGRYWQLSGDVIPSEAVPASRRIAPSLHSGPANGSSDPDQEDVTDEHQTCDFPRELGVLSRSACDFLRERSETFASSALKKLA